MHNLVQRAAWDELHRDEVHLVALADFVDGDDVRMIQRCGRSRLHLKARALFGILTGVRLKEFDRYPAEQVRIPGAKDRTHAALTQFVLDPVLSQQLPSQL